MTSSRVHCSYAANITLDGCGAVRRLWLISATVEELPRDWLRGCTALQRLQLSRLQRVRTVAADALRGAPALFRFEMTRSPALQQLPAQLFAQNFNLYIIDLSNNGLVELPPDLFGDDAYPSSKSYYSYS